MYKHYESYKYFFRILFFSTFLLSGITSAQPQYTVIDIGTLGGLYSIAYGINNLSQVVGESFFPGGINHGFIWENGVMTDLGTLGGISSVARGINNSSQVVGEAYPPDNLNNLAFLWENGVMTDLGTLGGSYSMASGINNSSRVVGMSNLPDNTLHAFFWDNGVMTDLGTLGGSSSEANCINNSNQIVGWSFLPGNASRHGFLWENGVMTDLGTLGGPVSQPIGINNSSQVVGSSNLPGSTYHAFIWENGVMIDLGTLGGLSSEAHGINNSSQVVGSSFLPGNTTQHAFLWENGVMTDLNSLIDPGSGWTLISAVGINDNGEIVGNGLHNGQNRAFILKTNKLQISSPLAGELWISGEPDTIRWTGGQVGQLLQLEYSADSNLTFNSIASNFPGDNGFYIWNKPDSILSAKCGIRIFDMSDTTIVDTSDIFKMKGYVLTRIKPDGNYEKFKSNVHGWNYQNGTLWPFSWWTQFNYATGIDPYTNELYPDFFHLFPPSSFVDWPLWVEVFTENKCYWSTFIPIYDGAAQEKWKSHANLHNGSCFGFAASSFLAFNYREQFFARHPGIPNVPNIFSLFLNNIIQKTINGYYAYQYGKQSLDNDVIGQPKDPRTTLQELKNMLLSDNTNISTITIYNNSGGGGGAHTMAPIRLAKDSSGPSRYRLFLYDSNNPGANTFYILIDSVANTWTDFTGLGATWTGTNHFYLEIPISNYLNTPVMGKTTKEYRKSVEGINNIQFYNNEKANVVYTSSSGNKIGTVNGVIIDEIDNGIAIFNKNGKPSDPVGYYIPDDDYSVTLSDVVDTSSTVYFTAFKDNVIYDYSRINVDSTQIDRIKVDDGFSVVSQDAIEKQINLTAIAELDSSERILFINGTQLRQNDSLYLKELNQSEFIIKNYGSAKTYQLQLNDKSSQEQEIFDYPLVNLQSNSAQNLVPNWDDLYGSQLVVLIDLGIDGTIDDTLYLNNTVDVEDQGLLLSPNSYNLAQNFPNPFNPVTTIKYSIPKSSLIVIKIYDVLGNEIATLVNEEKERGVYISTFDASGLASGLYLYRLQAGSFVETKKMILLK